MKHKFEPSRVNAIGIAAISLVIAFGFIIKIIGHTRNDKSEPIRDHSVINEGAKVDDASETNTILMSGLLCSNNRKNFEQNNITIKTFNNSRLIESIELTSVSSELAYYELEPLRTLAQSGYLPAQKILARRLYGEYFTQNNRDQIEDNKLLEEAKNLLNDAAVQGDIESFHDLGSISKQSKDFIDAYAWYRVAELRGFPASVKGFRYTEDYQKMTNKEISQAEIRAKKRFDDLLSRRESLYGDRFDQ